MKIKIDEDELILSERAAQDVFDLANYHEKHQDNSLNYNLVIMASVIEQSLSKTVTNSGWERELKKCKWYQFRNKKRLKEQINFYKKYNVKCLLSLLSVSQLSEIYFKVLELEGADLKKKIADKTSAEL